MGAVQVIWMPKRNALRLKSFHYEMIDGVLFWHNYDKVLLRCLEKDDVEHILTELHDGLTDSHFSEETIAHKIFRSCYDCPTLFKYAHAHAHKCKICHVNVIRERRHAFLFQPITIDNPFEQWGLDVVGEINLNSLKLYKHILTTTDCFSKWIEAIPLKIINDNEVNNFFNRTL